MLASMTAFARVTAQGNWGQAVWELRSVNHRYCELGLKIPDFCREWEMDWRQQLTESLQRGKVEALLIFTPSANTTPTFQINLDLVKQLLSGCAEVAQFPQVKPEVKALEILKWPSVLNTHSVDMTSLQAPLTALLKQGIQALHETRLREGQQLQVFLNENLQALRQQMQIVNEKAPLSVTAQQDRLRQKIQDITQKPDADRLEQELVYYAQRLDVVEEMVRLSAHCVEMDRILKEGGAVGRRLDFLMQEMNREVNTTASKSLNEIMSAACIEMKVLIEQIREQIQNLV